MSSLRIAGLALLRGDALLLVRKRGTARFMLPGGKLEPGETPLAALTREMREELGLDIGPLGPRRLGRFTAPAANEPDWTVISTIFLADYPGRDTPPPLAEIDAVAWRAVADDAEDLAPLLRLHVLPRLLALKRPPG